MRDFEIMHPSDAKAIQVLSKIKGFDIIASLVMRYGYERLYQGENLGELVRVTDENFPDVSRALHGVIAKVILREADGIHEDHPDGPGTQQRGADRGEGGLPDGGLNRPQYTLLTHISKNLSSSE